MKIISKKMPKKYTMVQSQDWHTGNMAVYWDGIYQCVERCKEPNVYLSAPGDMIEAIPPEDKRFALISADHAVPTAQDQANKVSAILKPVAPKIVGLGLGNHEWKLINKINVAKYILEKLDRMDAYGGWTYVFNACDSNHETVHKMFFTHGNFSLNSQAKDPVQALANMKAKLKNVMVKTAISDCIYMGCGHTHRLMVTEPTVDQEPILVTSRTGIHNRRRSMTPQNAEYIPPDARWYGNSGGFLQAYTDPQDDVITYVEVAGLGALDFGWLEIDVEDHQVVNVRKVVV